MKVTILSRNFFISYFEVTIPQYKMDPVKRTQEKKYFGA